MLAKFGYSRDHRPDREQIVIALMITEEGYPFYRQVLDGNTTDITTVEALVINIKKRFGIKNCTLVFDRGMVSADNLSFIQQEGLWYISAMDKDEIKATGILDSAMPEPASLDDWEQILAMQEFQPFDDNGFLYYREYYRDGYRYILSFDVARFLEEQKARNRRLEQAKAWIEAKNQELARAKKSRQIDVLDRAVKQMLTRKRVKKLFEIEIEPYTVTVKTPKGHERTVNTFRIKFALKNDAQREEQRLARPTYYEER